MIADGEPDEWPLEPAERIELVSTDPALRGPGETRVVLSAIIFHPPSAHVTAWRDPAGPAPGTRVVELRYGVELDVLPHGTAYRTADVIMTIPEDCRVVAAPDLPGSEHDLGGSRFRQHFDLPEAGKTVRTRLIVEVPAGRTGLTGSMTCEVDLRRDFGARWRRVPAVAAQKTSFTTGVPGHRTGSAVRLFVATDLAGFSRRGPLGSGRAQRGTAEVFDRATGATGIELDDRQVQGDGLFLVFHPAIDERTVLRAFYLELLSALREHNRDLRPETALRHRIGIDRGLSERTPLGWDKRAPTAATRLCDCAQARTALEDNPKAPFVLVVSDPLYQDIFSDPDHDPPGTTFTEIAIENPAKGFAATAWMHVAGE
ncbi:hypothetical protein [Amycolatopsis sp. RTGN1]|uniref:hypothetical protein n=1 Tax=Amycolatopsis ponsaeliensis TaxID=2992142 RepID=UPI00254DFEA6|nr:hypothetical protein [Amycolatopsis sp. RTGN1]